MGTIDFFVNAAFTCGMLLSLYAIYVEHRATIEDDYEALCDISETVSCSKVFTSEYGKIFSYIGIIPKDSIVDLPNAVYGAIFYLVYAISYILVRDKYIGKVFLLFLSVLSMILSAFLAYILSQLLHEMCIVCLSTYICNLLSLLLVQF
jgi:vitamin-K-epoxide reductase (warfarin-sensitive)